jgi:hypothetical protein
LQYELINLHHLNFIYFSAYFAQKERIVRSGDDKPTAHGRTQRVGVKIKLHVFTGLGKEKKKA